MVAQQTEGTRSRKSVHARGRRWCRFLIASLAHMHRSMLGPRSRSAVRLCLWRASSSYTTWATTQWPRASCPVTVRKPQFSVRCVAGSAAQAALRPTLIIPHQKTRSRKRNTFSWPVPAHLGCTHPSHLLQRPWSGRYVTQRINAMFAISVENISAADTNTQRAILSCLSTRSGRFIDSTLGTRTRPRKASGRLLASALAIHRPQCPGAQIRPRRRSPCSAALTYGPPALPRETTEQL